MEYFIGFYLAIGLFFCIVGEIYSEITDAEQRMAIYFTVILFWPIGVISAIKELMSKR